MFILPLVSTHNICRPVEKNKSSANSSPTFALNNLKSDVVSFSGKDFDVRKIKGLPCPYCGGRIYTQDEISLYGKRASVTLGVNIRKIMSGITFSKNSDFKVQNDIKKLMMKQASKSRSQNMQDILYDAMPAAEKRLINLQKGILYKAEKLSFNLEGTTKDIIWDNFDTIYQILEKKQKGETENIIFKRKPLIDDFMGVLRNETNLHNKRVLKEMVDVLLELPNAQTNTDSFIVKYHRRSSKEIMESLLAPCMATEEHIEPQHAITSKKYKNCIKAKAQINRIGNKMSAHSKCNNQRAHKPLEAVLQENPKVKLLMAEYIIALMQYKPQKLDDESLPKNYADKILKTIFEQSKFNLSKCVDNLICCSKFKDNEPIHRNERKRRNRH